MNQSLPPSSAFKQLIQSLAQVALTKRNLMIFGAFVLGCGLTGYFFAGKEEKPPEHVPLIQADATPYKVRPENDEQPQIPHEDKLIYNRLAPNTNQTKVERLLPAPEQPIVIETPSEPEANVVAESNDFDTESMFPIQEESSQAKAESFPLLPEKPVREAPPAQKVASAQTQVVKPMHRPKAPEQPKAKTETPKPPNIVVPQTPKTRLNTSPQPTKSVVVPQQKARYRIQLAALRTPTLARQEWHRLTTLNPQLKQLTPQFARIDLGSRKGIFYRVQSGRFATQEQAQRLCLQLKQKTPNLPCVVVAIDG